VLPGSVSRANKEDKFRENNHSGLTTSSPNAVLAIGRYNLSALFSGRLLLPFRPPPLCRESPLFAVRSIDKTNGASQPTIKQQFVHSYHATLKTVRLYRNVAVDSRGQSSVATTTTVRASHESRESDPLGVGDRQCVRLLVN
jgi:hypothetical protein